ncbi:MAG: tRNA preQ1(34) S-adenosylmethionine ribosyltransferase-isomerase QueA [Coriobacteriales bacterium]|jgi:S-adenosylmethionine:tRNA ribosyltransferase-isomerase|nr:tRNA preQ1(34) S-adenosylmethionine ribosyltransferase-isomerase QueA [Coriobacteriales bacterium]
MRLELFDYALPAGLIAQHPAEERDASRLLVLDRGSGVCEDRRFHDLPAYLRAGDVLVLNDSRVIPARLIGTKQGTGARIELFLLRPLGAPGVAGAAGGQAQGDTGDCWEALARPARRLKAGDVVDFASALQAQVVEKREGGALVVRLVYEGTLLDALQRVGTVPLPPYIARAAEPSDTQRYQTVFAREPGSAAAPTAGLHFTDALLVRLREQGVHTAFVTLHVGLGTFRPVQSEHIEEHRMHEELYHIDEDAAQAINAARSEGRRVVCVGTTSVRTLESAARPDGDSGVTVAPGWGATDIFLYPGGRPFTMTDALVTNFHLPKSTLLMLVCAFVGREKVLAAYQHAIQARYRFFSYGDAMLVV